MIVKLQRPLSGTPRDPAEPDIMVYDERRRHEVFVHMDTLPVWLRNALYGSPKVFAVAKWTRAGWQFTAPAGWRPW